MFHKIFTFFVLKNPFFPSFKPISERISCFLLIGLDFIGDEYSGDDTASYIAENYALEVSVWFWSKLNLYGYEGGVNEFVETKEAEGGNSLLIFLKTAYYVGGMPGGKFNNDINDAIADKVNYTITDDYLIINGNQYPLPSRWEVRFDAYEKAQEIW